MGACPRVPQMPTHCRHTNASVPSMDCPPPPLILYTLPKSKPDHFAKCSTLLYPEDTQLHRTQNLPGVATTLVNNL